MNDWHTRKSDEQLLMQFVREHAADDESLIGAVRRLEECHSKDLQEYSSLGPKQKLYRTAKYKEQFVQITEARETGDGWEYDIKQMDGSKLLKVHECHLSQFCL